jgi:hypothetical protein
MSSSDPQLNALEMLFWMFFFALEISWILIGLHEIVAGLYKVFRVDDLNRVLRELEELRLQKTEREKKFDRQFYGRDYVLFVNEK